jgi:Flp pilus assembly protein TadG
VEFAALAPFLFLVIFGIIEFGRAMMVAEVLNTAARSGCRVGVLTGSTNTDVNTAVTNSLTGVPAQAPTILVNGNQANVSTAVTGDAVTVKVSMAYSKVSWLPLNTFLGNVTLSSTVVMRHE